MPFEVDTTYSPLGAKIKIIGVGGCGGNAVNNMIERGITGVEFIACNTDSQALSKSRAQYRLQIGSATTKGLGAGFNPEVGKHAAEESREEISELIRGTDMLFITAGMGKGTGTGAAPVIANIARKLGILTIAIVTKPFEYEGKRTLETAQRGIDELRKEVDTLIVVQNEKILSVANADMSVREAYSVANDVLYRAAKGISEIVTRHGFVNVDFADVRNIMSDSGDALMGSATASGENRALRAAEEAISSPLLDGVSIKGSSGVLVNITGDVTMRDMKDAMSFIHEQAGEGATIIHGHVEDETMKGEISVTVIATGFNKGKKHASSAKQPELQVVRRAENQKPAITPPPLSNPLVGGKMERMGSEAFEKSDDGVPAFIKRGIPMPQPFGMKSIDEQDEQKPDNNGDKIRKTNPETPAFLRKIMD
ncbi:MAG: cell division protein FtsZ [Chloroherpetonaceae bacterium]|nr:cell division protein FtsZ [Chloroherpetonaceae bacterium]MDW8437633.1 cell division protein FtsZ [Chloroherpetonaceae bacterium]